jgi:excisionase family DNA binding protein
MTGRHRSPQFQHVRAGKRKVCTASVIAPGSFEAVVQAAVQGALLEHESRLRGIIREEIARSIQAPRRLTSNDDDVLTTAEAAVEAKCSEKTIRKACRNGALKATKPVGMSDWRVRVGDLRVWIAGGQTTKSGRDPEREGRAMAARIAAAS